MPVTCPRCRHEIELPGEALAERRKAAKLTLREMAEIAKVSHSHLHDVEHGRRGITEPVRRAYLSVAL